MSCVGELFTYPVWIWLGLTVIRLVFAPTSLLLLMGAKFNLEDRLIAFCPYALHKNP